MLPCERKNAIDSHTVLFGAKETEMKANYLSVVLKTTKKGL